MLILRVIVSKTVSDIFNNFVVVQSLREVRNLKGVTTLIIHTYEEDDFKAGITISDFYKSGITQFVYISEKPSFTLRMVLNGLNGYFFEDEFYLEDEEELLCLLDELGMESDSEGNELVATSSIQIVHGFIDAFVRGEEKVKLPMYLDQVNQAINELSTITQKQELQLNAMGNSALEVFERASTIIKNMEEQRRNIEKQLDELINTQNSAMSSKQSFGNSVTFFQPYQYLGNDKVLLIRELTPCRYLTSFLLGYVHHLHYIKNKRVKLVFVHQKGVGLATIYDAFASITQETINVASIYDEEVIATNSPKKEVMKEIFSKHCDVTIIVDRLYGKDDIVSGRVTAKLNAVSGKGDLDKFKVKAEDCIFSVTSQPNQFCVLPTIKQFPNELDARYAAYAQACGETYTKLDNKLKLL